MDKRGGKLSDVLGEPSLHEGPLPGWGWYLALRLLAFSLRQRLDRADKKVHFSISKVVFLRKPAS